MWIKSEWFDYMMGIFLMLNAAAIGVQVDYMAGAASDAPPTHFRIIDGMFCMIFLSELVTRALIFRSTFFSGKDKLWNIFDLVVVSFQVIDELSKLFLTGSAIQETIDQLGVLRVLRLARILRLARLVRLVPELKSLVYLIAASMSAFLWTLALLVILIFCVAVYYTELCAEIIREDKVDEVGQEALSKNFGTMWFSSLALFQAISGGDDWRNFVDPFRGLGSTHMVLNSLMFSLYIAFATLVMLNLVTGVFVEGAQRMIQDEKVTEIGKDVRKLFNLTDVDGSGDISFEEFELLIDDGNITMSNLMASLGVECHGQGRAIFKLLDTDNSGQIDVKEFVSGCMRLRGNARSIDLIMLKYDFDDFDAMVTDRLSAFETMLTKVMDNLTILQRKATISNKSLQLIEHDHSQAIRMLASQMEDMAPNLAHHMADQLGALSTSPFMPHATGDLV